MISPDPLPRRKCFFSIDTGARRMFFVQTRFSELCAVVTYGEDDKEVERVDVYSSIDARKVAVYTRESKWIDDEFTTLLGDMDVIGMVP